jgi:hypothetical protein
LFEHEHRHNTSRNRSAAAHFVRRLGLLNAISVNISNMVGAVITVLAIIAAGGIGPGFMAYLALAREKQECSFRARCLIGYKIPVHSLGTSRREIWLVLILP